jgi:hypothetical protein
MPPCPVSRSPKSVAAASPSLSADRTPTPTVSAIVDDPDLVTSFGGSSEDRDAAADEPAGTDSAGGVADCRGAGIKGASAA